MVGPILRKEALHRMSSMFTRLKAKSAIRGQPTRLDPLYSSSRWRRIRKLQLGRDPLCAFGSARGVVEPATICDHVTPHAGDVNNFWLGPFQSLCKRCHDSSKKVLEQRGYLPDIGIDGTPIDPRHPANHP